MTTNPLCRSETIAPTLLRLTFAGLVAIGGSLYAHGMGHAEVVSAKARYDGGIVVVRGKTSEPMQFVSMDRTLATRSNRVGRFVFRQSWVPSYCTVLLYSEGRKMSVPIKNCPLD